MEKQNKFIILVNTYNNEEWVEYNIASILNQTYTNYEVKYTDDTSTDSTYEKAFELIGGNSQFSLVRRDTNMGGTFNHISYFSELQDDEIVLLLDGDDWFFDDTVLEKLNTFYNEKDCWMTYGGMYVYDGNQATEPFPQNTEYPPFVHEYKLYRKDLWRASHLRSFRGFLVKSLDLTDFTSKISNKLFWHAGDLSLAFPCMEMAGQDRIGVIDFPAYVYNATPKVQNRTQERENTDNSKFEIEIRNKRKYKQGLTGEKLPNILVKGDYQERHDIPKEFTYIYDAHNTEYDLVYLQDDAIIDYLDGSDKDYNKTPIVVRICENRKFFNQQKVIERTIAEFDKFDMILTWDKEVLKLPNARFCPLTGLTQFNMLPVTFDKEELRVHNKTKEVSCVTSTKAFLPGHRTRLELVQQIQHRVDLYGRGIREIASKLEALKDYRYSVVIENDISENYYTEKLTDCLLTGTIPIYYGCPNISEFFDINGIHTFTTVEELHKILDQLSQEDYLSRLESILHNYEVALTQPLFNDDMYKNYYKDLLNM